MLLVLLILAGTIAGLLLGEGYHTAAGLLVGCAALAYVLSFAISTWRTIFPR